MKNLCFACIFLLLLLTNCKKPDEVVLVPPIVATNFTIPLDSIKVNPYGYTPLSARVNFTSENPGHTFLRVYGKHGAFSDVTHHFNDFGTTHSIPVLGLYADIENMVDIRILNSLGDTLEKSTIFITTEALPADMPVSIVAKQFDETKAEKGMYLVSNFSTYSLPERPSIPYFLDDYGDIRWVLDYSTNIQLSTLFYDNGINRLRNGNFYFGDINTSTIYEIDVLGKILNTWTMSGYEFHHNVQEESNGNFLVTVNKKGSTYLNGNPTIEDYIIEIDRNSKNIITEWDLKASLDENRRTWGVIVESDWIHCNWVIEDTTDHSIVVSGRNQGVIKLDYQNNVKWIMAPHKGWGVNRRGEDLKQFLLTPLNSSGLIIPDNSVAYGSAITNDFEWSSYQHSNIFLPKGNILVFDNGTNRNLDSIDGNIAQNAAPGKYSRAVEYKIDPVKKTIQQVWQFGKERDVECYSSIVSSVEFLPTSNHVIFAPGFSVPNVHGKGGKIIELDYITKEVINEISISSKNNWGFHRAKKMSVYPYNL